MMFVVSLSGVEGKPFASAPFIVTGYYNTAFILAMLSMRCSAILLAAA